MLPSSRTKPIDESPDTIFKKKAEVFCSQFKTGNELICIQKKNFDWPKSTTYLCFHCSEKIESIPFPVVKYHDPITDTFMVFGYFCRPCCALAHARDEVADSRSILWTEIILKKYFNVKYIHFAPTRRSLLKYGGTMSLETFYGEDENGTEYKTTHSFPFVTFSMYAEVLQSNTLKGLRRPLIREEPVQVEEQTEKPPLILEYLATKTNSIKNDIKKKKKATNNASTTNQSNSTSGNLLSYIVK